MSVTTEAFRAGRRLLAFLLPPACLACERLEGCESLPLGLCRACRGRLRRLAAEACAGCGRGLVAAGLPAGYLCGGCRRRRLPYRRLLAGWSYEPPLDAVIRGLKFGGLYYLGAQLASALHESFATQLAAVDLVVPVPLHWRRRLARGYDQAEEIARPLAALAGLPCRRVLRRRRATPPQARRDRKDRLANLRHAFCVKRRQQETPTVQGRRVLLVDDVFTTGATLEAAARALRRAGAAAVLGLAAGRTPDGPAAPGRDPARRFDRPFGNRI